MNNTHTFLTIAIFFLMSTFLHALDENACPNRETKFENFDDPLQKKIRDERQVIAYDSREKARKFFTTSTLQFLHSCTAHDAFPLTSGRIKLNFSEQTISVSIDRWSKDKFIIKDAGADLLLWAVRIRDVGAIERLLKKPDRLANLNLTDAEGKNALILAEECLDSLEPHDNDFERWRKNVDDLRNVFGHLSFLDQDASSNVVAFNWDSPNHDAHDEILHRALSDERLHHYAEVRCFNDKWWKQCAVY